MKCACGAHSYVKATRTQSTGFVRLRECANGHKFKTAETVIESSAHGGARRGHAANDGQESRAASA